MRKLGWTLAILLLSAGPASAQGFGLGPVAGLQKANDADEVRFLIGAAARLKVAPIVGVEGLVAYRSEEYADGDVTVRSWPVMLTGMIYPLPVIYGAVGVGWYNTTFDFDSELVDNETEQDFGWHLGAGAELPLGPGASLTGDIRYVFLDRDFPEVEEFPGVGDNDSDFFLVTIGLLLGL